MSGDCHSVGRPTLHLHRQDSIGTVSSVNPDDPGEKIRGNGKAATPNSYNSMGGWKTGEKLPTKTGARAGPATPPSPAAQQREGRRKQPAPHPACSPAPLIPIRPPCAAPAPASGASPAPGAPPTICQQDNYLDLGREGRAQSEPPRRLLFHPSPPPRPAYLC